MAGQTIILGNDFARAKAKRLIDIAPTGSVMNVREATRTNEQNDKMWAMLSDIARAKPEGRNMPTHKWKSVFMDYAGLKPDWEPGIDGGIVCVGYKSSTLNKAEMSLVIEGMYEYGARHGIAWSEPKQSAA